MNQSTAETIFNEILDTEVLEVLSSELKELINLINLPLDTANKEEDTANKQDMLKHEKLTILLWLKIYSHTLEYPLTLIKDESPDFLLESNGKKIGIEVTKACHGEYLDTIKPKSDTRKIDGKTFEVIPDNNLSSRPIFGDESEQNYANSLYKCIKKKTEKNLSEKNLSGYKNKNYAAYYLLIPIVGNSTHTQIIKSDETDKDMSYPLSFLKPETCESLLCTKLQENSYWQQQQVFDCIYTIDKQHKNIPTKSKANLRDNMTNLELIFTMLGEKVTTEISQQEQPATFIKNKQVAQRGGKVAGNAKADTEKELGRSIVSKKNYLSDTKKLLDN